MIEQLRESLRSRANELIEKERKATLDLGYAMGAKDAVLALLDELEGMNEGEGVTPLPASFPAEEHDTPQ
jgi:hypothetical protein